MKRNYVESNDKLEGKQWIPVYGIFKAIKDNLENKPSIAKIQSCPYGLVKYNLSALYHGITSAGVIISLKESLEKILQ